MSEKINDFETDLAFSHSAEGLRVWREVYTRAFPTMAAMVDHRSDGEHQRAGVDRSVILKSGKQYWIDEKIRREDYGDILLEFLSNDKTGAPGWVCKDLLCDFIAYAILPAGKAYLLPVAPLQAAWTRHSAQWKDRYGIRKPKNKGYRTHVCCVPPEVLYPAIGSALRVDFTPPLATPSSCTGLGPATAGDPQLTLGEWGG